MRCPSSHDGLMAEQVSKAVTLPPSLRSAYFINMRPVVAELGGQSEWPRLTQAAQGPVTLETGVLGPDQQSPHMWPQDATAWQTASSPRCH